MILAILIKLQILVNDWLPRVADLMEAMSDYWRDLVPMKSFVGRGEMLFKCIHALMSHQLNGLIHRSLEHLYETIEVYKVSGLRVGFLKTIWGVKNYISSESGSNSAKV